MLASRIAAVAAAVALPGGSIMGGPNGEFTGFVTLAGATWFGAVAWRRYRSGAGNRDDSDQDPDQGLGQRPDQSPDQRPR